MIYKYNIKTDPCKRFLNDVLAMLNIGTYLLQQSIYSNILHTFKIFCELITVDILFGFHSVQYELFDFIFFILFVRNV